MMVVRGQGAALAVALSASHTPCAATMISLAVIDALFTVLSSHDTSLPDLIIALLRNPQFDGLEHIGHTGRIEPTQSSTQNPLFCCSEPSTIPPSNLRQPRLHAYFLPLTHLGSSTMASHVQ
ncbi:hypothetical protein C8Q72DRAFT_815682 [Fomitopsis betulina]|nr:hypothetical protein C8Q72DRAFT_815682 [Fomitopsis betulina]